MIPVCRTFCAPAMRARARNPERAHPKNLPIVRDRDCDAEDDRADHIPPRTLSRLSEPSTVVFAGPDGETITRRDQAVTGRTGGRCENRGVRGRPGQAAGQARGKAENWLDQRKTIVTNLVELRDTASKLLADLGHGRGNRWRKSLVNAAAVLPVLRKRHRRLWKPRNACFRQRRVSGSQTRRRRAGRL